MADERRAGGEKPRAPHDHDLTGTGAPRSAEGGLSEPREERATQADEDVVSGMTSSSDPASSDEVTINRSGSGGTGGPVGPDESIEGSTGESLSELLAQEDDSEPAER